MTIRNATPADYPAFAGLFPELGVDDPVPDADIWARFIAPASWVAVVDDEVVGYCCCSAMVEVGYVRQIAVAPAARGAGVGRALMRHAAASMRERGLVRWALNVAADNRAAIGLYEALGMRVRFRQVTLRVREDTELPPGPMVTQQVCPAEAAEALERRYGVVRGMVELALRPGCALLEAFADGASCGMAVLDPSFPRTFPFRLARPELIGGYLASLAAHLDQARPIDLTVEDDEPLVALLRAAGALLLEDMVVYEGLLDDA